jgi:propane monooxygenase reductase subunit
MFYGVRTSADLLYIDEIEACGKKLPDFRFIAALSEEEPDPTSILKHGVITDVLRHEMGERLGTCDVYLCGPPAMVDAALPLLEAAGLEERRSIFYDKFTAS